MLKTRWNKDDKTNEDYDAPQTSNGGCDSCKAHPNTILHAESCSTQDSASLRKTGSSCGKRTLTSSLRGGRSDGVSQLGSNSRCPAFPCSCFHHWARRRGRYRATIFGSTAPHSKDPLFDADLCSALPVRRVAPERG